MKVADLIRILTDAGIEKNEAKCEFKLLAEHFCGYSADRILRKEDLTEKELELLKEKVLMRVETCLPVQYIIGEAWFMGNLFKVSPDVLIPRDETELLVRRAIEIIQKNGFEDVLDIGTGSGCIACSIAKVTEATVLGVDISTDALRIALDNVTALGINNRAIFRKSDLFDKIRDGESFDMIVSNPPYIPYGTELDLEVQKEPALALFAEENGLAFYRKIVERAPDYLNEGGYLMFELGIDESEAVKSMMEKDFQEIDIIKDLAGIDRVITGRLK